MDTIRTDRPVGRDRSGFTRSIAAFWDRTSQAWLAIWGPHIHHGYFETHRETPVEAQEKLIERLLALVPVSAVHTVLDAGCGIGGSSLYLASNRGAGVIGVTLSARQVEMASGAAVRAGAANVRFRVDDALALRTIADETVDVVWSLESCEQFYDKRMFVRQAFRVLRPGGRLMLATWCSDADEYAGREARRYRNLCVSLQLPYMPTIAHYGAILREQGFAVEHALDWSEHVKATWAVGIDSLRAFSIAQILRMAGWRGLLFKVQAGMMRDAFESGRVRYGVFVARKPGRAAAG